MIFSLDDFTTGRMGGNFSPPRNLSPYMRICWDKFRTLKETYNNNNNDDLPTTWNKIRLRVAKKTFFEMVPLQMRTINYSRLSFPGYQFILPAMVWSDWYAIVGHQDRRRDHLLHQPLTAYIVQKLLKGGNGDSAFESPDARTLLSKCINFIMTGKHTEYLRSYLISSGLSLKHPIFSNTALSRTLWELVFLESAYLAAVFHDMGYPWEYINNLSKMVNHATDPLSTPTPDTSRELQLLEKRLLLFPFNGYRASQSNMPTTWPHKLLTVVDQALRNTHGLPGAVGFLYLNDFLRDYPDDTRRCLRQFCVDWAAMAIAMHDMKKIYWGDHHAIPENPFLRLKIEQDPLSCIITLADVLQEFHRPTLDKNLLRTSSPPQFSFYYPCTKTELEYTSPRKDSISITHDYSKVHPITRTGIRDYLKKEERLYFHPQYGYIDFSAIGIRSVSINVV